MATLQEMRSETLPHRTDVRWFHSETVTDAASEPLIIPSIGRAVSVSVVPGTNALVQFSMSSYADLEVGTETWHDWPAGTVTVKTSDVVEGSVSALRMTSTGASTWEVTA